MNYVRAFNMCSVVNRTAFSKNTAGGVLLISSDYSLKIFRAPFNSGEYLITGGNKRSYILKQTFN